MRILIYTGKGGVGKTSISAATAFHLASMGKKVLIMSTDQAHSLSDSFEKPLSSEPQTVFENIDAMEINTVYESKKAWKNLHDYLRQIISEKANDGIQADEALLFPGFDELFSLLHILDAYEQQYYDVMIVDCAPTGQTLALLSYAEKLSVFADKIVPMIRTVNTALGTLIAKKTSVPKPKDIVFDEFSHLVKRLTGLQTILHDRSITSMRMVLTLEHIVLAEAKRSYAWMQLYDFGLDAVYINKIYPDKALDGYFESRKAVQEKHKAAACESFSRQKIFTLALRDTELRGAKLLREAAASLYGSTDPAAVFFTEAAFQIDEEKGPKILRMYLPFIEKNDIAVSKEEADLIVSVRNETRRFHLPYNLGRRQFSSYKYEDNTLNILFDY